MDYFVVWSMDYFVIKFDGKALFIMQRHYWWAKLIDYVTLPD